MQCCFCDSRDLILLYSKHYHPIIKEYGPFDFYRCKHCGSGLTLPAPAPAQLDTLYRSFAGGMDEQTRKNRDTNPLDRWYQQCIGRALRHAPFGAETGARFSWVDIAAGNGELAKLMALRYPDSQGLAIDFHPRPAGLQQIENLRWLQCDLNKPISIELLPQQPFDLAFSITVLEHVRDPFTMLENFMPLLKNQSLFYITVPDYSSVAASLLKTHWPYYIPGEHINIPSKTGLRILIRRLLSEEVSAPGNSIFVNRIILPYPISYYLQFFRLPKLASFVRKKAWVLKLPTGILEALIIKSVRENLSQQGVMDSEVS